MLATIHHSPQGEVNLPPLMIAHGLFGSGRNWGVIAKRLAQHRQVIAVDMRNHGLSPRADSQSYPNMANDLAEVILSLGGGPVDMIGHSMGGKAAMQLALTQGALLRRVMVADIAPVAYAHDQSPNAAAMLALDLTNLTSRGEADLRLSAHIADPALRAFFLQSLDLLAKPPHWQLNLPVLLSEMPKIVGWPGTQGRFDGPVLFLAGSESHYIKADHRDTIRALFPAARFAKLMGAGHWLHAEKPREFEETARVFLGS